MNPRSYQRRLWVLAIGGTLVIVGLIARLGSLQTIRFTYYEAVAANQRKQAAELAPNRGSIYMQESRSTELFPVAVNTSGWTAYAVPRDMSEPLEVAQVLAPALVDFQHRQIERINTIMQETGQTPRDETPDSAQVDRDIQIDALTEKLYDKFNKKTDPYEPFLKFYEIADPELKQFIEDQQLEGIVLQEQKIRTYPEKDLAAHVLGYVGWQDDQQIGRYGIEGFHQTDLRGTLGFFSNERDASGDLIGVASNQFEAADDGTDIILTVDRVVQSIIEEELADGVGRYGAERGSITVMDPNTGAILGMATFPNFDPNYYYAIQEPRVQLNPVISEIFEPGSILKPLIMAAAIEEKKVTPSTTMVDDGPVRVAKYTINTFDGQHHGVQTMTQLLEKSNNVGMVWVGQQLGAETMYDYLRRFGLGERTGIELEGETRSALQEPDKWNITTVATTSFGQGVALTPLQSLNAINAIANGGLLPQPYIVAAKQPSGGERSVTQPITVRQVVSASTAADISAMMVSVIENGVAQLAKVKGYYLAGKTGTAQVPDDQGTYSADQKIITFVGFGPVSNPRFSIMIKLDNPSGLSFASGTAAPMFRHIATKLLNYYQIPPDYDDSQQQPTYTIPSSGDQEGA